MRFKDVLETKDPNLITLLMARNKNQIYIILAMIMDVACLTGMILNAVWIRAEDALNTVVPFLGLAVVGLLAFWLIIKLAKENYQIDKKIDEAAKELGLIR